MASYMKEHKYHYPLSIQLTLPEDFREDAEFRKNLSLLQNYGFFGIELNIARPELINKEDLNTFLKEYGLKFTMFASGAAAKAFNLSLSHNNLEVRKAAVQKCIEIIDFSAKMEAGVILGFFKGGPSRNADRVRAFFSESLGHIAPYAWNKKVPLLVESTNRYESAVANNLADTYELIKYWESRYLRLLPDTFHMNIEESNMYEALRKYAHCYDSLHISDNNRYFPGLGAIDFAEIIRFLKELDYKGGIAIEGNIKNSFIEDLEASMSYLAPILS